MAAFSKVRVPEYLTVFAAVIAHNMVAELFDLIGEDSEQELQPLLLPHMPLNCLAY